MTDNLALTNGIFCLLSDNLNCIRSWGFFLFSPEFDDELELRNRIGAIWFCSLLDSLEGGQRVLRGYREQAIELDLTHLMRACEDAQAFLGCVKEVVDLYSREEQIFLNDFRDQTVHSWLARRHRPKSTYQYYDGEELCREKLSKSEHANLIRPFYEQGCLDQTLHDLTRRFRDLRLRYWHATIEMSQGDVLRQWYAELRAGRHFSFKSLKGEISGEAHFIWGPSRS